jgi:mRNA interferase RelE/StbE
MFEIRVTKRFEKDFRKVPTTVRDRILHHLDSLKENPYGFELLSGEFQGLRRLRVGDYRIIFRIEEKGNLNIVHLLFIAHRRAAYR